MTGLDRLIEKIETESQQRTEEILAAAALYEEQLLMKTRQQAIEAQQKQLEKAEFELAFLKERIHSSVQLRVRNDVLRAKQSVISSVLADAQRHLSEMNGVEFFEYLKKNIVSVINDGHEILKLNAKCFKKLPPDFSDQLNTILEKQGVDYPLKIVIVEIEDGFVVSRDGVDMNFTFRAQLEHQREAFEAALAKQLFEGV